MTENAVTRLKFAFTRSLASYKNFFKGENPPKQWSQLTKNQRDIINLKWKGKLGDEYRKQVSKTVKPGKGKFALPSQKPGSMKPPTIKPPSNIKKVTQKVGGNKSRWFTHVDEFRAENPEMTYKEALKAAAPTYKPNQFIKRQTAKELRLAQKPEKQVGVVKILPPEPPKPKKDLKPRKLNQKQMKQRWNRIKSSDGSVGEGFEKFYVTEIKGKRFANNEEIEKLIETHAHKAIEEPELFGSTEADDSDPEQIKIDKHKKEQRKELERIRKDKKEKELEHLVALGADKEEVSTEGTDHFESGKGHIFSEVKGLDLPVVPYYYVEVWIKNHMGILRRLKKYKKDKTSYKYLLAERDYYLNLHEYEWNDFTDLPEDQQTEAREKALRREGKDLKREYKEKIKKAKGK